MAKPQMSVFHIKFPGTSCNPNGMPQGMAYEVSPAAYLSWDSALPYLFFNSKILGSKPLLKDGDSMENPYNSPGADGIAMCGIPEGSHPALGHLVAFLHSVIRVRNFFL